MAIRLKYHFEPQKGWINDPNGLIFFKGKYHAFFQHYPHAPKWGPMHWGHAVSDDLINWEELPIALFPDKPYENSGGCYSGSAIIKDGLLYLFYTSVSNELGQTQSFAVSKDGIHFEKYENNPVIKKYPEEGSRDFRDPKVTKINDKYYMVCGSGKDNIGKILLFESLDLVSWKYVGVLFSDGTKYGRVLECPDFFQYEDKYVLMFSQMELQTHSTVFVYGDFDGKKLTPISVNRPEIGPHFYAPQTFLDKNGRRILIGWLYSWSKKLDEGADFAGALTIPRELCVVNNKIQMLPVKEAAHLLTDSDHMIDIKENTISVIGSDIPLNFHSNSGIFDVKILKDTKTIEVFINNGEASLTYWFNK